MRMPLSSGATPCVSISIVFFLTDLFFFVAMPLPTFNQGDATIKVETQEQELRGLRTSCSKYWLIFFLAMPIGLIF